MAGVVAEADEVRAGLEQVREEAQALCRLRVEQLQQLGHLDDAGCADDGDAQALADAELDALGRAEVDVVDQRLVADGAQERGAEVRDGLRQVLGHRLEGRAEDVHGGRRLWMVALAWGSSGGVSAVSRNVCNSASGSDATGTMLAGPLLSQSPPRAGLTTISYLATDSDYFE